MATPSDVSRALHRARRFVANTLLPHGELPVDFVRPAGLAVGEVADPSPNTFATIFACHALLEDPAPEAMAIIERARPFLYREMLPPGLWRYCAEGGDRAPRDMAPDLDGTATMLRLEERLNWSRSSSRWILESNKRRDGRFYTWVTPWNRRTWDLRYWRVVLRDPCWKRFFTFWKGHWWHPRDIDVVINIHIVTYLGDVPATQGAIAWILETVDAGAEELRDKWYHDRSTFYLALSRAYAGGITRFGEARARVVERIAERAEASGQIGRSPNHTVMCASALLHFGVRGALVDRAIDFLCASQDAEGAWPAGPHFWGGLRNAGWFGSRTYTTALACETLALYRRASGA